MDLVRRILGIFALWGLISSFIVLFMSLGSVMFHNELTPCQTITPSCLLGFFIVIFFIVYANLWKREYNRLISLNLKKSIAFDLANENMKIRLPKWILIICL